MGREGGPALQRSPPHPPGWAQRGQDGFSQLGAGVAGEG